MERLDIELRQYSEMVMSADNTIRELVETHLSDNHKVEGVEFVNHLLVLASDVGEIKCTLADGQKLRFETPDQLICEVHVDRAKTKLRMLCARLGVLCHEAGDKDVPLYGGEGTIKKEVPMELTQNNGPLSGSDSRSTAGVSLAPLPVSKEWRVRFKNTPSQQEFIMTPDKR
jgi:hypothetical protein